VIFLPALWFFGWYVSPGIAAALGVVFLVARVIYLRGYASDPKKRGPGALLTGVTNLILMLGGLIGAVARLV
jgi:multisubunit Na+/H+ antiporter MnhB subunit